MNAKQVMLERWPDAVAENVSSRDDPCGYWTVWNKRGAGRGLYGVGKTESDAWQEAASSLGSKEYRPRARHNYKKSAKA